MAKRENCISCQSITLELEHKPDEYVGIGDMISYAKVMAANLEATIPRETTH